MIIQISIVYTQQLINRARLAWGFSKFFVLSLILLSTIFFSSHSFKASTSAFSKSAVTAKSQEMKGADFVPEAPELTCDFDLDNLELKYNFEANQGRKIIYQSQLILPSGEIEVDYLDLNNNNLKLAEISGVWQLRVRAFYDNKENGLYNPGSDFVSDWSQPCSLILDLAKEEEEPAEPVSDAAQEPEIGSPVGAENILPGQSEPEAELVQTDLNNLAIKLNNVSDYDQAEYQIFYDYLFEEQELTELITGVLEINNQDLINSDNIYLGSCSSGGECSPHQDIDLESILLTIRLKSQTLPEQELTAVLN